MVGKKPKIEFLNIFLDGENIQARALLTMLRQTRLGLEGQHSVLEQSIRQTQRIQEQTSSYSSSRSSYSSSSSTSNQRSIDIVSNYFLIYILTFKSKMVN